MPSKEKTKRNATLLKEKTAGATYRKLSTKYDLSIPRLIKIIGRERDRELQKIGKRVEPNLKIKA